MLTPPFSPLTIGPKTFDFSRPYVMGVLNVTPDSFSDGGRFFQPEEAFARAQRMVEEGADLIDIGGESTRPGARALPVDEELRRVLPVIRKVAKHLPVPISIDTYKAQVAEAAVGEGAHLVNDISTLRFDPALGPTVARLGVPLILMHTRGRPEVMQKGVEYRDVVGEVCQKLKEALQQAEEWGIAREKIWLDPGFGFGKRHEDNRALLMRLPEIASLGHPLVVGLSRKSTLGEITGVKEPEERLGASVAAATLAVFQGAHVIRAHDVKETAQAVKVASWARGFLSGAGQLC